MEKKKTGISQTGARMPVVLLKSLLVSYLMAGALLLLLALLLYRMQLSAQAVSIGILVIYAVTAGLSGWLAGKGMQDRRFFMGTFDRESVFLCAGSFDFDSQSRSSGCRKSLFYYTDDLQRRGNAGRDAQLTPGEGQRRGS